MHRDFSAAAECCLMADGAHDARLFEIGGGVEFDATDRTFLRVDVQRIG